MYFHCIICLIVLLQNRMIFRIINYWVPNLSQIYIPNVFSYVLRHLVFTYPQLSRNRYEPSRSTVDFKSVSVYETPMIERVAGIGYTNQCTIRWKWTTGTLCLQTVKEKLSGNLSSILSYTIDYTIITSIAGKLMMTRDNIIVRTCTTTNN